MSELEVINDRQEMIRFLDGYSADRKAELDERKAKRPLVKSYLLEQARQDKTKIYRTLPEIFARHGAELEPIDSGSLWKIYDKYRNNYFGFIEAFSERYSAIYTVKEAADSDHWVRNLVISTSELDHFWISGWTFNQLWQRVVQLNHPSRFARIVFLHNSIFEIDQEEPDHEENDEVSEDFPAVVERRAAKFSLVDRISVVGDKLNSLQQLYSPLYAISQLRFPSPSGKGGHDFYDNGKVTNRSDSFRDHRSHLLYVQRIYDKLITSTEEKTWFAVEPATRIPGEFNRLLGAPVLIKFSEPLSEETYQHFIASTFGRGRNRFRLWGNPLRLGPTKCHIYGLDRHLWQPLFLEITDSYVLAMIPRGTCGNTVHRLITNIQRYLDPSARAYIGNKSYDDIVRDASVGIGYDIEK